ncbi:MAG TPA: hypothetical protein PLP05_06355 [Sedimentisphaerales bacterium]|nr:hypothetical protein [Sedimentisphaerales bacterium]
MDGMFYSLEQTAKKLNKTEEEVNAIVKEGRLRVFFDGPNQLFKVDEVASLLADTSMRMSKPAGGKLADEPMDIEDGEIGLTDDEDTMSLFESSDDQGEGASEDIDDIIGLADDEDATETGEVTDAASDTSAETAEVGGANDVGDEDDFLMLSEDQDQGEKKPLKEKSASEFDSEEDDVFADLSETLGLDEKASNTSALTNADDTTLNGGGVNILGETDGGYDLASDTMGETKSASDFDDDSMENIEDDVNLDSFGSGSGLLDLSLQADDTSLGGILDEIYTSDEEGHEASAETEGSAMAVTAAAEEMFSDGDAGEPNVNFADVAMLQSFEAIPDTSSNMLGATLILPFVAMVYTIVIVLAGGRDFKPSILKMVEGYISYIFIGFIAVALIFGLIACFAGGDGVAKEKKPKAIKEKKPKVVKEKKPKVVKEKKAKK